jgi:hypothetical protein
LFHTEGENGSVQKGPAVLVGDAEPADQLAVAQANLVLGVDLPGLVRRLGAVVRAGPPPGDGGGEIRRTEPALEGARGRQVLLGVGEGLAEVQTQVDGTPLGVQIAQSQGTLAHLGRPGDLGRPCLACGQAALGSAEGLEQVADGARRQLELLGQQDAIRLRLGGLPQGFANRLWDRSRHGSNPQEEG